MRTSLIISSFLLSAAVAVAQTAPTTKPEPQRDTTRTETGAAGQKDQVSTRAAAPKKEVPPATPVITIQGECAPAPAAAQKPAADCKTVVTRAEFEKLVNALNPEMPPETRARFAENYGRLLVVAAEARKAGADKLPGTEQLYNFAKLQVLAQQFGKKLQDEAANIPESEIDAYYRAHLKDYDQVSLQRLIIPRSHSAEKQTPPPSEAEEKAAAEKFRDRWIAGEDPEKLQKEAYKSQAPDTPTPPVKVGERRRSGLPMTQQSVFDLKAGEVSQVFVDPAAFFIYKVNERETKSLDEMRDEIKKTLASERLQKAMDRVTKAAEAKLNQDYFAPNAMASPEREKKPAPSAPPQGAASKAPVSKSPAKPAQTQNTTAAPK